jgi:hypothetical protein
MAKLRKAPRDRRARRPAAQDADTRIRRHVQAASMPAGANSPGSRADNRT